MPLSFTATNMDMEVHRDIIETQTISTNINSTAAAADVVNANTDVISEEFKGEVESLVKRLIDDKKDSNVKGMEGTIVELGKYAEGIPFLGKILSHVMLRL